MGGDYKDDKLEETTKTINVGRLKRRQTEETNYKDNKWRETTKTKMGGGEIILKPLSRFLEPMKRYDPSNTETLIVEREGWVWYHCKGS